ncbi:MAG: hypothetical protein ACOX62_11005 [Christensenellales bacterium]|jgi:hypothetical protein
MKKLLAMALILSLFFALPALAELGSADVSFEGTNYHLTLDSIEIDNGRLTLVIAGMTKSLSLGANGVQFAAMPVPYYGDEALYASDRDIFIGTEFNFRYNRDTLPDLIMLVPTEKDQEPILLWERDSGTAQTTIPEELVGEWRGTGKPKNGGQPIDLTAIINADGSGEYTFDQGDYHESYPFTITNDDSRFSVDIPATSQLGSVNGSWSLEEGVLKLDITSTFTRGGSYSYTAECKKADRAEEADTANPGAKPADGETPAWAGRGWQLRTLHFKTLSEDSPFTIDAGMTLNGPTAYGSRLSFDASAAMSSDIDLNGLIEAVPELPFSVPELNLTQYGGFAPQEDSLRLTPGDILLTLAYDAASDSLSLTYIPHVEVQSRTLDNGLSSKAGETDIEIILGFVPEVGK